MLANVSDRMKHLFAALFALVGMNIHAESVAVGAPAPDISQLDENGKLVQLSEVYSGSDLTLVYFYPKADTSGCTAQACSLRDAIVDLGGLGVTVIGVSHDTPAQQLAFKKKYELPFTLLADADGKVIEAFGVPTYPGGMAQRESFLIQDGKVVWRASKAKTAEYAQEIKDAIASLKKS